MDKIKSFSNELPYFIHNSLKKSEQLTQVMVLRGYGKQSRRGVYPYNPLTIYDGLIISAIMLTYGILEFYGAI
jgi:energy-coupling factor transporter transmembrane protein EcfT